MRYWGSGNPVPLPCKNTTKVKRNPYQTVFRSRDRRSASPPRASSSNSGSIKASVRPAQPNQATTVSTLIGSVPTLPDTPQVAPQETQWQQPYLHPQTPQSSLVESSFIPQKETIPKSLGLKRIPTAEQINLAQQALQRLSESTNIRALFREPPISVQEELKPTPLSVNIPLPQLLQDKETHSLQDSLVPLSTKVQSALPPLTPRSSKRRPTPTGPAALVAVQNQLSPVQRPHAIATRPHASPISHQTPNAPTHVANGQTSTLTRELWDVRRQMVALKARESSLMTQIKDAGGGDLDFEDFSHFSNGKDKMDSHVKQLENEVQDLKYKLKRTSSQLEDAEIARDDEKKRRIQAERLWDDARREYRAPLVVPAMMDAFEKLARLASDALSDMNNDDVVFAGRV